MSTRKVLDTNSVFSVDKPKGNKKKCPTITGGTLAAQVMKNDGVKHLFEIVGGPVYPIFEGCVDGN
jgi:hypothetical protein